ncbi:hypothetical protein AOA77_05930 [Pseudomonas paraeruginosa]|nr:hypothetical protein AN920_09735 [Pseudomonas paraeruginosa]KQB28374.1 hypothetical protein AOA77_05930 [Pseudomonas paraeruginosa]
MFHVLGQRDGGLAGVRAKKKTICGGWGDGLQRSVGDLGFSDAATISCRPGGEKCFGLIVAIDADDL